MCKMSKPFKVTSEQTSETNSKQNEISFENIDLNTCKTAGIIGRAIAELASKATKALMTSLKYGSIENQI